MPQQVEQPNRRKHHGSRSLDSWSAQLSRSMLPRAGKLWPTRWQRGRKSKFACARALVGREEIQGPNHRRLERQSRAARIWTDRSDLSAASFTTRNETLTTCAENKHKLCEADGITPELSRTALRRRMGATYHRAEPTPRSGVGLNEQLARRGRHRRIGSLGTTE